MFLFLFEVKGKISFFQDRSFPFKNNFLIDIQTFYLSSYYWAEMPFLKTTTTKKKKQKTLLGGIIILKKSFIFINPNLQLMFGQNENISACTCAFTDNVMIPTCSDPLYGIKNPDHKWVRKTACFLSFKSFSITSAAKADLLFITVKHYFHPVIQWPKLLHFSPLISFDIVCLPEYFPFITLSFCLYLNQIIDRTDSV